MRRIHRRMSLTHLTDTHRYVELLRHDPVESTALFKDLLIRVTSFFREPAAWQALQEQVIRRLGGCHAAGGVRDPGAGVLQPARRWSLKRLVWAKDLGRCVPSQQGEAQRNPTDEVRMMTKTVCCVLDLG